MYSISDFFPCYLSFLFLSQKCGTWFRRSQTPLPKPLKPPSLDAINQGKSIESSLTAPCKSATYRFEGRKYKNISVYILELPPTPNWFRERYNRNHILPRGYPVETLKAPSDDVFSDLCLNCGFQLGPRDYGLCSAFCSQALHRNISNRHSTRNPGAVRQRPIEQGVRRNKQLPDDDRNSTSDVPRTNYVRSALMLAIDKADPSRRTKSSMTIAEVREPREYRATRNTPRNRQTRNKAIFNPRSSTFSEIPPGCPRAGSK
jgi:hypothetical protein